MSRLYLLDTNTVIYILKGRSAAARARLAELGNGDVACISAVTEGELRYGVAKAENGKRLQTSLDWFLGRMKVLAWGREEAAAYGVLRATQERVGKSLAPLDTQIAAHAVAVGALVVTNDRAFQQVDSLLGVESWATDL